jgi:hypothetical protein
VGSHWQPFRCIWLYDPQDGRFRYSKEFTEISAFEVHPDTKTLTTHGNGGQAGSVFRAAKYIIDKNRPVAVMIVAQDYDFKSKKYHCIVQERRGPTNEVVTIRDLWQEAKPDAFEGPCDPSDPFRGVGDK